MQRRQTEHDCKQWSTLLLHSSCMQVTGDNSETARKIASACGLLTSDGICMEGKEYRALSAAQREDVSRRLDVLSRAVPQDKLLLVTTLEVSSGCCLPERSHACQPWLVAYWLVAHSATCFPCRRSMRPWRSLVTAPTTPQPCELLTSAARWDPARKSPSRPPRW